MWLECICVVSGFCCKEVYSYNYIDILIINNWGEPQTYCTTVQNPPYMCRLSICTAIWSREGTLILLIYACHPYAQCHHDCTELKQNPIIFFMPLLHFSDDTAICKPI